MQCPQCTTESPDNETYCRQCGTNLRQQQLSTFSYLPEGTPPWPTAKPQKLPHIVDLEKAKSSPIPTAASIPSRPRRKTTNIIGIVAVLILAPAIGILGTFAFVHSNYSTASQAPSAVTQKNTGSAPSNPTPGNTTALPDPKSFKTVSDATMNISLQYPSDWTANPPQKSSNETSMSIAQSQFNINFFILHITDTASASIPSAEQLNQSNIQELSQFPNLQNIKMIQTSNATPTIGGTKWTQAEASFTDTNNANTKLHFTTISVHHGKSYYVIYYILPDVIYQQATLKYLQPMLNSVKFLS
jgi:hypothetical protein